MKIYVVGSDNHYSDPFFERVITTNIEDADMVLFTGGEDVSPAVYGAKKHPATGCNPGRDEREIEFFDKIRPDQLVVGICRGSQFLCAINGGKLVQHCTNHAIWGTHALKFEPIAQKYFNAEDAITSTHHQMQFPYDMDKKNYTLIATSKTPRSFAYEGNSEEDHFKEEILKHGEPEIVLYHVKNKPLCLAVQGHPEMLPNTDPIISSLNSLVTRLLHIVPQYLKGTKIEELL